MTPKLGLVDQANHDAHYDMPLQTFIDSLQTITEYFDQFYLSGNQQPMLDAPLL